MNEPAWYTSHQTLVDVASLACDNGELTTSEGVLDFFEKPWHYPELHKAWCAEVDRQKREDSAKRAAARASRPLS